MLSHFSYVMIQMLLLNVQHFTDEGWGGYLEKICFSQINLGKKGKRSSIQEALEVYYRIPTSAVCMDKVGELNATGSYAIVVDCAFPLIRIPNICSLCL